MNFELAQYKKMRRALLGRFAAYLIMAAAAVLGIIAGVRFLPALSSTAVMVILIAVMLGLGALLGIAGVLSVIYGAEAFMFIKSKGQYLYKLSNGLAFSEKKDMELCEKLAAEGYRLIKFTRGFYKYERSAPQEWSYSVDYTEKYLDAGELQDYTAIFESGGWEYICSSHDMHWFRAPKGTTPIYTDNDDLAQKYKTMRRTMAWGAVYTTLTAIIPLVCLLIFNFENFNWVRITLEMVTGASLALALAMSAGVLLNHRRVRRLGNSFSTGYKS